MGIMRGLLTVSSFFVVLFVACSDDGAPAGTPKPTASSVSVVATSSPSPQPSPSLVPATKTPQSVERVALTVWLIDAESGRTTTLVQDFDLPTWWAFFGADGLAVYVVRLVEDIEYSLAGVELHRGPEEGFCARLDGGQEQAPGSFEARHCRHGLPKSEWIVYGVDGEEPLEYAAWAEDRRTGERFLLQDGLRHCGGCDSFIAGGWSPSGNYLVFTESGTERRVFLSDLANRTTRLLSSGNGSDDAPQWSPNADILWWPTAEGLVVREDLVAGTRQEFPDFDWPVRFDSSGDYVFSPGFVFSAGAGVETRVADAESGEVLMVLSGAPPFLHF